MAGVPRPRSRIQLGRSQRGASMTTAARSGSVGRRRPHIATGQILVASFGVALALAVALGGGPSTLDDEARRTLSITVLGLGLWGAFPQRAFWPSILVIGLVLVSRTIASPSSLAGQVVQLYGTSGVWTPLTGFLLAHAVMVSGQRDHARCWLLLAARDAQIRNAGHARSRRDPAVRRDALLAGHRHVRPIGPASRRRTGQEGPEVASRSA